MSLRYGLFGRMRFAASGGSPDPPAGDWTAPIGIPTPAFGITDVCPEFPADWSAAVEGYYWIEPTHASATNTNNTYGYASKPRATIPTTLPAGAVVKVVGTYATDHSGGITINGTSEAPVWIRGTSALVRPTFTKKWAIKGTYGVLEYLTADWHGSSNGKIEIYPLAAADSTHLVVRHCSLQGDETATGGVYIVGNSSYAITHLVIYHNTIYNGGDWLTDLDQDCHSISMGWGKVTDAWIVDNTMHHCSGNAVQVAAGSTGSSDNSVTARIYVGRNTAHHIMQDAFWTKAATDVIFSENVAYSGRRTKPAVSASNRGGFGHQYGPDYVWYLFNTVHDCQCGIDILAASGGTGNHAYIVGNLIYDIHDTESLADLDNAELSEGVCILNRNGLVYIVDNTLADYDGGIFSGDTGRNIHVANNLLAARNTAVGGADLFWASSDELATNELNHNLFEELKVRIGANTYTTVATLEAAMAQAEGHVKADPAFTDEVNRDYTLQAGSPAVGASGGAHAVYADFEARYGRSIQVDKAGTARPVGAAWDIGCYER